jgi:hypothetical protein
LLIQVTRMRNPHPSGSCVSSSSTPSLLLEPPGSSSNGHLANSATSAAAGAGARADSGNTIPNQQINNNQVVVSASGAVYALPPPAPPSMGGRTSSDGPRRGLLSRGNSSDAGGVTFNSRLSPNSSVSGMELGAGMSSMLSDNNDSIGSLSVASSSASLSMESDATSVDYSGNSVAGSMNLYAANFAYARGGSQQQHPQQQQQQQQSVSGPRTIFNPSTAARGATSAPATEDDSSVMFYSSLNLNQRDFPPLGQQQQQQQQGHQQYQHQQVGGEVSLFSCEVVACALRIVVFCLLSLLTTIPLQLILPFICPFTFS